MKTLRTALSIGVMVAVLGWSSACSAQQQIVTEYVRSSIPYVATRSDTVKDMLWMPDVTKDDVVYDLGSGDGRIVIAAVRDFGVRRAVGVEKKHERVLQSRENARKAGVSERVEFIEGDLYTTDFSQASVVTLFLGHRSNIKLRPKILSILKPGTRIVSHQFNMGEWQPGKTLTVFRAYWGMIGRISNCYRDNPQVPDYEGNESDPFTNDKILMWVVPAPVAGIWRGKIETPNGPKDCKLNLHQSLSEVTGTFQLSGQANPAGRVLVELWGNHVRTCGHSKFDGHVHENTMQGTIAVNEQGRLQESSWKAQRDEVDFTGTWEWPCPTGQRSVRLCIERRNGDLIATYLDQDKPVPVTDFYDFGGGFYFTLLIGREGASVKINEDTGWLIGEGIIDNGALKGTIEFYPYGEIEMTGDPVGAPRKAVVQDWEPRLIKP
jgi:hypothetical protein